MDCVTSGQRQTKGDRWFLGSQAGETGLVSSGQEHSMKSLKLKQDYQTQVHSSQKVLVVMRLGDKTVFLVA
jgi:hypothetical protein